MTKDRVCAKEGATPESKIADLSWRLSGVLTAADELCCAKLETLTVRHSSEDISGIYHLIWLAKDMAGDLRDLSEKQWLTEERGKMEAHRHAR